MIKLWVVNVSIVNELSNIKQLLSSICKPTAVDLVVLHPPNERVNSRHVLDLAPQGHVLTFIYSLVGGLADEVKSCVGNGRVNGVDLDVVGNFTKAISGYARVVTVVRNPDVCK